jgi:hypothetical protein
LDVSQPEFAAAPAQVEVYTNTKLLWQVGYDNVTSEHVFTGELLMLNGTAVQNQDIKIFLNETLVTTLRTNETGFVEYRRHFDAGDETITYNVQATFEGTDAQQATLNSTTFDGEDYTVCTVTYFQYKPSANMTSVTVEPHATEVTVPIQSPEEMQQQAQDEQTLCIWPEFSWWYPWFKIVAEVNVPFDLGTTTFRFELMPLVFQQAAYVKSGEDALVDALIKIAASVAPDVLVGYFLGSFLVPRIAAHIASSAILNVFVVLAAYAAIQVGIAIVLNQLLGKTGLVISIISFFLSAVISAFLAGLNVISDWVQAIYRGATGQIKSIWHSWWGRSLGFANIVEVTAFFFLDTGLGSFLSLYL